MPIEQYLLDYAAQPEELPAVDNSVLQYANLASADEEARKRYLRDKYVWGLASDFSGTRKQYRDDAIGEISDPLERQFLVGEVTKVRKAMEWIERKKYEESGFAGRFIRNLGKVGDEYVEAGAGIVEAVKDIAKYAIGYKPNREDAEFRQAVDYANLSQDFELSGFRGLTQKAAEGMAGFAPDMAAGMAAGVGAGPAGMFAYWTARQAPEQTRRYIAMGIDPSTASLAGYGTSALSAAIELFNYDPTGLMKKGGRSVAGEIVNTASRIAKEEVEEPWQATTESALQYFIGKLYPGAKGPEFSEVADAPGMAVKETFPAMIGIGIAGGGGKNMRIMENASIEKEILRTVNEGKPVSRSQWKRWGLLDVEKTSQDQRNDEVAAIAETIKTRDQAEAVLSRTPPTERQWSDWGFPKELGQTPEDRMRELDAMLIAGAALEAAEITPDSPGEALETIRSQESAGATPAQIASEATLQPEGEVNTDRLIKIEDDGDFLEDESGNIGVRVEALIVGVKRGFKKAKHLYKKFVTTKGELTPEAFDLRVQRDLRFARHEKQISFLLAEANRAITEVHGDEVLTSDQRQLYRKYLHGEIGQEEISEPMRAPLNRMRDQIDALSRTAIEAGVAQGELAIVVDENQGFYATRGYRVFDDAKYELNVPGEVRNKFAALLRERYPEKSEAQVQGLIAKLLYEGKAADRVFPAVSSSQLKSKDLSILRKRTLDEMPELRALYGEYDDFRLEYAKTVTKLGNLVAQHRFLTDLRQTGLQQGFFAEEPTINQFGELKKQVAAEQSEVLYPLNGLHTTPEIYDALTERSGEMPDWLRVYMLSNAIVKVGKTILSPMTHIRNAVANVGFAVQNGHWRVGKAGIAFKTVHSSLMKKANLEFEGYILRLVELGVLGEEVNANELRDYIRDFDKYNDFDDFAYDIENRRSKKTKRLTRKVLKALTTLYQLEDSFWKVYAFENEKARYRKAIPAISEMSDEQLEEKAAKIVRNTYPTYSLVPAGVKGLRRFPLVGTFVSFPAEVIRTTYHSLKLSMEEMSDPRLRKIGATRFAGNMIMLSGTTGLSYSTMLLAGVSPKDEDDMRHFVAPWQRNNQFLHFGRTEKGNFRIIDLTYSDPHSILRKPFKAFMRGENLDDKIWDGLTEAAEPFLGMEILAQALIKAGVNENNSVRNPSDTIDKQAIDTTKYIWDNAFKPGAISSMERIAKGIGGEKSRSGLAYSPSVETVALISGQRLQDIDIAQSLTYKLKEFSARKGDADGIFSYVAKNRGSVSGDDIINAYRNSENARMDLYGEFSNVLSAARRLQVSEEDMSSILTGSNVSKSDIYALYNGVYIPRQFSKEFYKSMYNANPDEYDVRVDALRSAVEAMRSKG
uniref:Putative structural protein n=1 Tax=viral metagenome TaxID=1070528 RepID=A0A6M3KU73_9ZZZZ